MLYRVIAPNFSRIEQGEKTLVWNISFILKLLIILLLMNTDHYWNQMYKFKIVKNATMGRNTQYINRSIYKNPDTEFRGREINIFLKNTNANNFNFFLKHFLKVNTTWEVGFMQFFHTLPQRTKNIEYFLYWKAT